MVIDLEELKTFIEYGEMLEVIQALEEAVDLIQYNTTSDNGMACKRWLSKYFPEDTHET